MVYSFNYPTEWHNGVLVKCNECKLKIFEKIEKKETIDFNEKYRESSLYFIIQTLHSSFENYSEFPLRTKQEVIQILTEHGQFSDEEIKKVYDEVQAYTDWTTEWEENLKNAGYSDDDIFDYTMSQLRGTESKFKFDDPIKFNFGIRFCDTENELGMCYQKIEKIICPDCQMESYNCPDYVNALHNINCPRCKKILIRSGVPDHHGYWDNGKPILKYWGTDYFSISHPNCKKSKDGDGGMFPVGIWAEHGRLIIHLKCDDCGYENVIKYRITSPSFLDSIYTDDRNRKFAKLKKINYRTFDLLSDTESKTLEFKSSFYGINDVEPPTSKSIKSAKKQIIDEILGFLNSDGGVLLIGIEKNKDICGIGPDFDYIRKKSHLLSPDQFTLDFKELLQSEIAEYAVALPNINLTLENLPIGKTICIIDVLKSNTPVFNKDRQLIVNCIGAKKRFTENDAVEYIKEHFK